MTPLELDAALDAAMDATRFRWDDPFRRRRWALWLTQPTVIIGGLSWHSTYNDHRGHAFTRTQVKAMKRALQPILAGLETPLANLLLAVRAYDTAE